MSLSLITVMKYESNIWRKVGTWYCCVCVSRKGKKSKSACTGKRAWPNGIGEILCSCSIWERFKLLWHISCWIKTQYFDISWYEILGWKRANGPNWHWQTIIDSTAKHNSAFRIRGRFAWMRDAKIRLIQLEPVSDSDWSAMYSDHLYPFNLFKYNCFWWAYDSHHFT